MKKGLIKRKRGENQILERGKKNLLFKVDSLIIRHTVIGKWR